MFTRLPAPSPTLYDGPYRYAGLNNCQSVCHLRVCRVGEGFLVVATELPENRGTSVTNACEILAAEVCRRFRIPAHRLTGVEHRLGNTNPRAGLTMPEEYSIVTFDVPAHEFRDPMWSTVPKSFVDERIGPRLAIV